MATAAVTSSDRQWFIVGRWEEFGGEARANLLRIVAVGAFYGVQLVQHFWLAQATAAAAAFHQKATAIAVAWTFVALAVLLALRLRIFPAALKYVSTACDLLLLTALASLAAGPSSPLIQAYYLIIALAALRFSLGLVWFSTLGAMAGYWLLVGLEDAKTSHWFDAQHAVPPVTQLITLLSLGLTGIVIGQVVRRSAHLAAEYAQCKSSGGKRAMTSRPAHRDYAFLGTTQSLCPECLSVVPAKIIEQRGRVYFRKTCPEHGTRDDFVCSDVKWYDRMEYALPARMPAVFGVEPEKGCPLDCGLCTEHEQHTCVGVLEITGSCNLTCPMCYAGSSPGGKHLSLADCKRQICRLVEVEGRAEVCQLSGGEPTVHPQFAEIVEYALSREIDYVMVNTNGIRFARDPALVELLARHRQRMEVYFQFDGLHDGVYRALRGEELLEVKLAALEALGQAGVHVTLVATLQGGVNDDQLGPLVEFGLARPWITGISFQPATYSGRHVLPETLERRITFPDVIRGIAAQTNGVFAEDDFLPLPCAHPNCHQIAIAYRQNGKATPVTRFIDAAENVDLLANGISFTRGKARELIRQYLARQACCGGACGGEGSGFGVQGSGLPMASGRQPSEDGGAFFEQVLAERLGAESLFRLTITNFLDAYNFDVRRVMKCCTHHVLPSGHVIPFCAYNVLYRDGHVPLPPLREAALPRK